METKSDPYEVMLAEIDALMDADPDPDSPEGMRLNELVDVVIAYERLTYPEFS